jgi:hypothetical protein
VRSGWSPRRPDYPSDWLAICAVASRLGIGSAETLRNAGTGFILTLPPGRLSLLDYWSLPAVRPSHLGDFLRPY